MEQKHRLSGTAECNVVEMLDESPNLVGIVPCMTCSYLKSWLYERDDSWVVARDAFPKLGCRLELSRVRPQRGNCPKKDFLVKIYMNVALEFVAVRQVMYWESKVYLLIDSKLTRQDISWLTFAVVGWTSTTSFCHSFRICSLEVQCSNL
jgi:hypothetical protein